MRFPTLPYWIKGGLITLPLSVVLVFATFFLMRALGGGGEIIFWLAPEYAWAAIDLGMRGEPATLGETVTKLGIAAAVFFGKAFVVGAILGSIYGVCAKWKAQYYFLALLIVLYVVAIALLSHKTMNPYDVYGRVQTAEDCEKPSNASIDNFNVNVCYHELAVRTQNVAACDKIVPIEDFESEDTKWFCYEEVAHAMSDATPCESIPRVLMNDHGVSTGRRNSCFWWFRLCEKIDDLDERESCLSLGE